MHGKTSLCVGQVYFLGSQISDNPSELCPAVGWQTSASDTGPHKSSLGLEGEPQAPPDPQAE